MNARVLAAVAALFFWSCGAYAQHSGGASIFPQLGHSYPVMAVAYSPDGKILATGGADKSIKLWDMASGRELRTLICVRPWLPE